ncbi:nuclear transport factor 2 family protein [Dokdonia sp.]|uniref:nuclear transport factor 2 family protein n=1 Tax=Dokdonia sp. TaxID=2024995 RepID=UPI0032664684
MEQYINKLIVTDFYKKVIGEQDLEYAKRIVTEDYIQHNPQVRTGKAGFLEAIAFLKQMPKQKNTPTPFMRIIADNEYVIVHLNVEFGGQKKIVLDMFRIENGLIAEHWDAIQNKSEISLNGNSEIEGPILIENEKATIQNKKIVEDFTNQILIEGNFQTLKNFVVPDLIQHNPKMNKGLKGIAEYYQKIKIQKVHKIIGQGNFVVTQSKAIVDNEDFVFYDIYRLDNGLIIEHWAVSQIIPEVMAHNNGMI